MKMPPYKAAFSLVETVLAMAVMSLAVTVLLGLLPHGLEMSRKAGISAGEARISGDLIGELSQAGWTALSRYDRNRFYFDDQGVRLAENQSEMVAYVARVTLPGLLRLPSGSGAGVQNADLQRVTIDIASTGNRDYDFDDQNASYSTYAAVLSRTH